LKQSHPKIIAPEFAPEFLNAVHGGLDKVLGASGTTSVLFHVRMEEVLPDAAEFHKKLLVIFGEQGTLSLERAIIKDLATRLRWSLDLMKIEGAFDFEATMTTIERGVEA
jgi:hypothetical protein